ncbi:MAG: YbhB/YbcL family Raf kinase inhibitor-like protein [Myxococcales bacterium]|nr:YbhB/YbcL family Raf kinase inhibitor-like protein [Myxococcales bacterium]
MRPLLIGALATACTAGTTPSPTDTDPTTTDSTPDPTTPTPEPTTPTASTGATGTDTGTIPFVLTSPDMEVHETLPCEQQLPKFAECGFFGGDNINPRLEWSGVPEGTVSLVLVLDDISFGLQNPIDHWGVYDIPPSVTVFEQGISGTGTKNALPKTTRQTAPYAGSCSDGQNTYRWRLAALDAKAPNSFPNPNQLENWARKHIIGVASMCHCPEGNCETY